MYYHYVFRNHNLFYMVKNVHLLISRDLKLLTHIKILSSILAQGKRIELVHNDLDLWTCSEQSHELMPLIIVEK